MRNKLQIGVGILAVAILSILVVSRVPIFRVAENLLYDLRISHFSEFREQSPEIVIVGITEETLSSFPYRSPIDRQFLGKLLRQLEAKDVRLIGLDILIDQATEPAKDKALRAILSDLKMPLVVATAGRADGLLPAQVEYLNAYLTGLKQGSAAVIRDRIDGVIRAIPIQATPSDSRRKGFAAQMAEIAGSKLPDNESQLIDFMYGPDSSTPLFPIYPANSISLLPGEWFAGKIVVVGFELEFEDRYITPLTRVRESQTRLSGVQIHAQALSQLLENRRVTTFGIAWSFAICVLFSCIGFSLLYLSLKLRSQLTLMASILLAVWTGGILVFIYTNTMVKILPPSIALALSSLVSFLYQWRNEQNRRQFIHLAFSKYLTASYVDQLVANPDQLEVKGEHRELTFLFTDLGGFTPLTEALEPEVLVSLINEYLDRSCEIVTRHGGMVACIVGDALHVLYNAPIYQHDHAQRAVEASLELDAFCQDFRSRKREQGIQMGETRIGINTGITVVGNFGGRERIEYTAMGDPINTAARLESVNKHLGTRICISESTVAKCNGIIFRPVGNLWLKGKSGVVSVFEPIGANTGLVDEQAGYMAAFRLMENEDGGALDAFRNLSESCDDDPLIMLHLNRLMKGETGTTIIMSEK